MRTEAMLVALAMAGSVLAAPARAQDAGEILQTALDRYAERAQGVENYTVVYGGFMGSGDITTYYEKEMVDGFPVFRTVSVGGTETGPTQGWDAYAKFPEIAERAEYRGTEEVDGVTAHVLTVDDFEGFDFGGQGAGAAADFEPEAMTLWIDGADWLIRRMRIEGTAEMNGEQTPMTMVASLRDYRVVEGMPFPYVMAIEVEGAMAASGMSDEEAEEAREQLAELREQLENMPEQQREMMQRLMGSQIENLEKMVGSGTLEMTIEVQDLRVNTGPPSES